MNLGEVSYIINNVLEERKPDLVIPPADFGRRLNVSQLKLFNQKIGAPETYQPGMPVPAQAYEITKRNTDDLQRFKVIMGGDNASLVLDENGEGTLPSDFFYPSYMAYKYTKTNGDVEWKDVEMVTDKEWIKRVASFIKRPSLKWPIYNIYQGKVRTYPVTLNYVDFMYLRLPVVPVMGSSWAKGYRKYDPNTSTELEWDDLNILAIINIFLGDLGVEISNQELVSISEKARITGT